MMKLELIEHRSKFENGKIYMADEFRCGNYQIERYVTVYPDQKKTVKIYVEADMEREYLPKIYYEEDWYGKEDPRFEIQTTAYGTRSVEEIEKVIAGYQEAIEVVKVLTRELIG